VGQLESRTTSIWNPDELLVPVDGRIVPTLRSCGIINLDYVLKVSAIIPWGLNLTVDITITIGNAPLHSSTSAPNPFSVISMVQPQFLSPQWPAPSTYPTQDVYPPSDQSPPFGPGSSSSTVGSGDFQSAPPPSYEAVVANPNEYMHITRFWLVICTDNICTFMLQNSFCDAITWLWASVMSTLHTLNKNNGFVHQISTHFLAMFVDLTLQSCTWHAHSKWSRSCTDSKRYKSHHWIILSSYNKHVNLMMHHSVASSYKLLSNF